MMPTPLKELDDAVESVRKHVAELSIRGLPQTPTAFNWTDEMQAIWPKDMRPTMSGLLAIWEAMQAAAVYGGSADGGPWIEWKGGECPVAPDAKVDLKFVAVGGFVGEPVDTGARAKNYDWSHGGVGHDIIAYRVLP